jgi:hypothetical protein
MPILLGSQLTFSVTLTLDGAAHDSADLLLVVTDPTGAATTFTAGQLDHVTASGHYKITLPGDIPGVWTWAFSDPSLAGGSSAFFVVSPIGRTPWCTVDDVTPRLSAGADLVLVSQAIEAASDFLYQRTRRMYPGLSRRELRPCCPHTPLYGGMGALLALAWPFSGQFTSLPWSNAMASASPVWEGPTPCACGLVPEIILPARTVTVEAVKVDGTTLVEGTDWRLDRPDRLVRLNGRWPSCQNLSQPDTASDTFSVHAILGRQVPTLGRWAAAELAAEFFKAHTGADPCALPKSLQQLVRQGVTIQMPDPSALADKGYVGLWTVDRFLQVADRQRRPASVLSPDMPASTVRTIG